MRGVDVACRPVGAGDAEAIEHRRETLCVVAEIFSRHADAHPLNALIAKQFLSVSLCVSGDCWVVVNRRITVFYVDLALRAEGPGDAAGDAPDVVFHLCAPLFAHHAERSGDVDLVGYDVSRAVGDDFAERQHGRNSSRDYARHKLLHRHDYLAGYQHVVGQQVGHPAVPAAAFDAQVDFVAGGHVSAGTEADAACGHVGHDVRADDDVGLDVVEESVVHHDVCAAGEAFFAWLEDEHQAAGPSVAPFVEDACRGEQRRRVEVVAAGVHHAVVERAWLVVGVFVDGQRVHVGTQSDGRSVAIAVDEGRDAVCGKAGAVGDAVLREFLLYEKACLGFMEREFRVPVHVSPQCNGV